MKKSPSVQIKTSPLPSQKNTGWIVWVLDGKPALPADSQHAELKSTVQRIITSTGFKGNPNEIYCAPGTRSSPEKALVIAGLGKRGALTIQTIERAAATAAKSIQSFNVSSFSSTADLPFFSKGLSLPDGVKAIVRGWAIGQYRWKMSGKSEKSSSKKLTLCASEKSAREGRAAVRQAAAASKAAYAIRDLANTPGNLATPARIAQKAKSLASKSGLTCSVFGPDQLRKKKCDAILAVGAGSRNTPRLITLKYHGRNSKLAPIVLVGKTITFDTGGISLKPARNMEWMRYDKCGGMAVMAAMETIAALKPARSVIALLPAAENMPGGAATRPGDIINTRAGKTVEVLNTDAEGRLVLADALSIAADYKPKAIIDFATLTGTVIVALGNHASAVLGNDDKLSAELQECGRRSGEKLWPLPLWEEYEQMMHSPFADLKNTCYQGAGTITAAAFLKQFVPDDISWAHIDIAGTAWEESEKAYAPPGATLFGADLVVDYITSLDA